MTEGKAGDRIEGISARLLVLLLVMVVAGFVIPSPGIAGEPGRALAEPGYRQVANPAVPEMLIVPTIRLRAPILPIEVKPDGVLSPPADVDKVGWWKRSARPGAQSGQTLVTGHTVHTGGGVMNRLGRVRPGELIQIRTAKGIVDYRATKVFVYTREELAEHAHELFGQKRKKIRLVLVTCTGWDGRDYTSNIIVFADQLGVRERVADRAA